ncbi:MAG TPA: DUF1616 domain-containing protein [Candidatus Altiarchaeales archaeon]|nr:DUF1616 domain-containing protein [Candidatus Altiarchaeales archaeon]
MWVFDVMRAVFGFIYVLFIPGFTATWALFPKKSEIDWIERITLSFALSIALTVLPVMFLNYWPGIPVTGWTVFFTILLVTSITALIALKRISLTRTGILP